MSQNCNDIIEPRETDEQRAARQSWRRWKQGSQRSKEVRNG